MEVGHVIDVATGSWGPAAIVALATILFFTGKIIAKPTVDKILKTKDDQLEAQKLYFEGRIHDLVRLHSEQIVDLRDTRDKLTTSLALQTSNVNQLLRQNDELQEITRTISPALLGARNAAENRDNERHE